MCGFWLPVMYCEAALNCPSLRQAIRKLGSCRMDVCFTMDVSLAFGSGLLTTLDVSGEGLGGVVGGTTLEELSPVAGGPTGASELQPVSISRQTQATIGANANRAFMRPLPHYSYCSQALTKVRHVRPPTRASLPSTCDRPAIRARRSAQSSPR